MTHTKLILTFILFIILSSRSFCAGWRFAASMHDARSYHTATLLPDGRVLAVGGINTTGSLSSCEVYNPTLNSWTVCTHMLYHREGHTATLLPNGKVLVVGGYDYRASKYLKSCELYDPANNSWSLADSLHHWKSGHTATLLDNGNVLVIGGDYATTCEIYDISTSKWTISEPTHSSRMGHTATKLTNGKVMIIGSWSVIGYYGYYLATCELFNLQSASWSFTDSMKYARAYHSTTMLQDGRLFISGGTNYVHVAQCEIYDPVDNIWTLSDSLHQPREDHCSITLPDGEVLIIGGQYGTDPQTDYHALSSCELREIDGVIIQTDSLMIARHGHEAILLQDESILVIGGSQGLHFNRTYLSSCELYAKINNDIHNRESASKPPSFQIEDNYPNPFNSSTKIIYYIPNTSHVKIEILDINGRLLSTLIDEKKTAGHYTLSWSPVDLCSGIYFYRIISGNISQVKKCLLLK